jgi:hypothetical protein
MGGLASQPTSTAYLVSDASVSTEDCHHPHVLSDFVVNLIDCIHPDQAADTKRIDYLFTTR